MNFSDAELPFQPRSNVLRKSKQSGFAAVGMPNWLPQNANAALLVSQWAAFA